jgi:hypothetical protein
MNESQYLLNMWLEGLQNMSGPFGGEKNLLHISGFEPLIIQPMA